LIDGTLADEILVINYYWKLYACLLIKNKTDIKNTKAGLVIKVRFGQQSVKFEKTRASIARKVSFVYSLSQQGGYHAAR
jgi:hypothetical protein